MSNPRHYHSPSSTKTALVKRNGGDLKRLDDLGFSDLKKQILLAAGIGTDEMGDLLRLTVDTLANGMQATHTQYFSYQGEVIDQRTDPDHSARLKAAAEMAGIVSVLGDLKRNEASSIGGGTQITLNVPFLNQLNIKTGDHQDQSPDHIDAPHSRDLGLHPSPHSMPLQSRNESPDGVCS